ncbi:hypothetical protein FIBSPDRAFT_56615 [Athelia psychrophila]|uniref:Uncharacterized protein n=1 Tax=Athelia psychrophila TaxID=1759441 RepID=A0A166FB60_9AGAM|nr:hypothetical protein FIBSPDRAFT_56615 [Fibularhizoctonia sp. CBS 109695]
MTWHVPSTSDKSWLKHWQFCKKIGRGSVQKTKCASALNCTSHDSFFLTATISSWLSILLRSHNPSSRVSIAFLRCYLTFCVPAGKGYDREWHLLQGAQRRALTTSVDMVSRVAMYTPHVLRTPPSFRRRGRIRTLTKLEH